MENFGVAKGDIFKSFPKEIPQLSIIHYQFVRQHEKWQFVGV